MIYILNGSEINNKQFVSNEITYPNNWLCLASRAEIEELGVIILDEIYENLGEDQHYDGSFVDDFDNNTRTHKAVNIIVS